MKLADFGWSICSTDKARSTFCGTLDYISPEMAKGAEYNTKLDNWAIGVLTFEFLTGKPPFEASTQVQKLNSIKKGEIKYPDFMSAEAKDFISNLLETNVGKRMEIKEALRHPFIRKHNKSN